MFLHTFLNIYDVDITFRSIKGSMAICETNALHLPFRSDRITELTGKTRGGGLCFYINEGWCSDVTTLKKMCSPNLEALFINCKPFYSSREFCSFILVKVYVPPDACVSAAMQYISFCEDICIPTRTFLSFNNDKPWFTGKLKQLRQAKEDAYRSGDKKPKINYTDGEHDGIKIIT